MVDSVSGILLAAAASAVIFTVVSQGVVKAENMVYNRIYPPTDPNAEFKRIMEEIDKKHFKK
jgi:hypothetical protein